MKEPFSLCFLSQGAAGDFLVLQSVRGCPLGLRPALLGAGQGLGRSEQVSAWLKVMEDTGEGVLYVRWSFGSRQDNRIAAQYGG